MISNYNFYFIIWDRPILSFVNWNKSYRNHQMKLIIIRFRKKSWFLRSLKKIRKQLWKKWMNIIDEELWVKIALYASKSTADSDRFSPAFFFINRFFFIIIISTADFSLIWSDQTKPCQHLFLPSISYRLTFQ